MRTSKEFVCTAAWSFIACGLVFVTLTAEAQFGPPKVTVPVDFEPPPSEAYPSTVSAANIAVNTVPDSVLGGAGSNSLLVMIAESGPTLWTDCRHNEGDIAFNLGVSDPLDPLSYPSGD